MSKENHAEEWKESWRDEYLRWVCGFANGQGGVLVIGKNNQGRGDRSQQCLQAAGRTSQ